MTIIRPSLPGGSVIFCDDIRAEAHGKQIFIGVYLADMQIAPSFPAMLPTFNVFIRYAEHANDLSQGPVRFVILNTDDAVVFEATLPQMPAPDPEVLRRAEYPHVLVGIIAALQGFVIPQAGAIRVRAYRGDDEIQLGALQVRLNPQMLQSTNEPPITAPGQPPSN